MRLKNLKLLLALIVLAAWTSSSAVAQDQPGAAGASYLLVPNTAHTASLGVSVTGGMQNINGLEAMQSNPANLMANGGTTALFSRMEYAADIGVNTFGAAQRLGSSNIALMITSWDFGDIALQTEDAPEITDLTWSASTVVVGVGYARQFTDRISAGVVAKLLNERIDDMDASGVAFDAGMHYLVGESGLSFGVSLRNFGPQMEFGGDGLLREGGDTGFQRIDASPYELPAELNFGASYRRDIAGSASATLLGNFRSNSYEEENFSGGLQLGLRDIVFVRGGYQWAGDTDDSFYTGWNFGAGLALPLANTTLRVDYAYRDTDFFDAVQLITASIQL